MEPYRVLIIEDDPQLAADHARLIAAAPRFAVVGTAASADEGAIALARARPDLVLLDIALRGEDGLAWLRHARARRARVEVIVLSGPPTAATVRASMHLGALDYLVRPFTPERLRQALARFLDRASALQAPELDQAAVDRASLSQVRRGRWLPKGLSPANLAAVRDALAAGVGPLSAQEVSNVAHMDRATAYRYLEYLLVNGEVELDSHRGASGRPRKLDSFRGPEPPAARRVSLAQ